MNHFDHWLPIEAIWLTTWISEDPASPAVIPAAIQKKKTWLEKFLRCPQDTNEKLVHNLTAYI
jgi:hypothetical protein